MNTQQSPLDTYIDALAEVLHIVGYTKSEVYQRTNTFLHIFHVKFAKQIISKLPPTEGKALSTDPSNSENIANARRILGDEFLGSCMTHVFKELLDDYLKSVLPACNETQKQEIDKIVARIG